MPAGARVLRSRDRTGAYLISLCIGTALFGMFFFLTLFVQNVWGYSALKTGISYLPMVAVIMVASAAASQLLNRIGARPLMIAGSVLGTAGMIWLSRVTEHSVAPQGLAVSLSSSAPLIRTTRYSLLEPASGQGAHGNRCRGCRRRAGPGTSRVLPGCATTPAHRLAGDRRSHRRTDWRFR